MLSKLKVKGNGIENREEIAKRFTIKWTCSHCGFSHEETVDIPANYRCEIGINPTEIFECDRCTGECVPSLTESDTPWYPSPNKGKKRVLTFKGKCDCTPGPSKSELVLDPTDPWTPTTHNQKCPQCNKEYYLDWTETERTYL